MDELERLTFEGCELVVKGGKENTHGKVNILLQAYISRVPVDSFSLISDMAYVAQVSCVPLPILLVFHQHLNAECPKMSRTFNF